MPSWGGSFKIAIKAIIVGIAFAIVGIIIIIAGGLTVYEMYKNNIWVAVALGIPIMVVGLVISSIGFYAALIKFITEEAVKEMSGNATGIPPPQSQSLANSCPNCRTPLVWVEQYKRWYCPKCKQYVP